jgi:hypothetical protein
MRSIVVVALLCVPVVVSACDPAGPSAGSAPTTAGPTTGAVGSGEPAATITTTAPTAAVTEPTGVPGVDDADPWCAAWARYAGSLQVVSVAIAFGGIGDVDAARLELAAAPAVRAAIATIAASWPAALASEREAVLADLLGPFDRRAARAESALVAAGATDDDLAVLRDAWTAVLRARDPDVPTVELPALDAAVASRLAVAAEAFAAAATRFDRDPSLVTDTSAVPATRAALARECPDLASSGLGDAI